MFTPVPRRLLAKLVAAGAAFVATGTAVRAGAAERADGTSSSHIPLSGVPTVAADDGGTVRAVHSANPFTMFGFTWRGAPPDRLVVRHAVAGGWSPWLDLEQLVPPVEPAGVHGSNPVWTGGTQDAQIRAERGGRDVGAELEFVAIMTDRRPESANPQEPDALRPDVPHLDKAPMPKVVTRAQWGADESVMTWPPQYMQTTKAATVHHTADGENIPCSRSAEAVRGIYRYHAVDLQWGDIGYHAVVDSCGTIFEGRTNGLQRNVIGGHAAGFNQDTFGIAILGNYDNQMPTSKTLQAVAALAAWKLDANGVHADGKTRLVSQGGNTCLYPAGTAVTLPVIFGHRDVCGTHCPGEHAYTQLAGIRQSATRLQNAAG